MKLIAFDYIFYVIKFMQFVWYEYMYIYIHIFDTRIHMGTHKHIFGIICLQYKLQMLLSFTPGVNESKICHLILDGPKIF